MDLCNYYCGRGEKRPKGDEGLPLVNPQALGAPEGYMASSDLVAAVDVALTLGMPLLLTGEPGSGKSRLAHSIAWELNLGEPLVFVVKSETEGKDLFYRFDTVGRFHAAQTEGGDSDPRRFVTFNALGRAIFYAKKPDSSRDDLGPAFGGLEHPGKPRRSVVLIDEIDKAPRDVPNDILSEIENMSFCIPEIATVPGMSGREFNLEEVGSDGARSGNNRHRPIVVITSNSEKGLPDAFLRRCVYYHLPFPKYSADAKEGGEVTVESVVEKRLGKRYQNGGENLVADAISLFKFLREQHLERKPSLAELLNWLDYLLPGEGHRNTALGTFGELDTRRLRSSLSLTLLKQPNDQQRVDELLSGWRGADRSTKT